MAAARRLAALEALIGAAAGVSDDLVPDLVSWRDWPPGPGGWRLLGASDPDYGLSRARSVEDWRAVVEGVASPLCDAEWVDRFFAALPVFGLPGDLVLRVAEALACHPSWGDRWAVEIDSRAGDQRRLRRPTAAAGRPPRRAAADGVPVSELARRLAAAGSVDEAWRVASSSGFGGFGVAGWMLSRTSPLGAVWSFDWREWRLCGSVPGMALLVGRAGSPFEAARRMAWVSPVPRRVWSAPAWLPAAAGCGEAWADGLLSLPACLLDAASVRGRGVPFDEAVWRRVTERVSEAGPWNVWRVARFMDLVESNDDKPLGELLALWRRLAEG